MPILLWSVVVVCPLLTLLLVVRLALAPFSQRISDQMRKHPAKHIIWGCFAFVGILVFLGVLNPSMWPPRSVERRQQRQTLLERVRSAGGWDAVRRDCISIAEQHTNGIWLHGRDTNLPPAVAALKPLAVAYEPRHGCVRLKIFGLHSSGGRSTPYFGLEVDTSSNSAGYKHGTGYDNGGVIGNRHSVAEEVAEGIYELY